MKKQITQVLEAVQEGCATSEEVSDATGLSIKHCSSYLSELADAGLLARKPGTYIKNDRGRRFNFYRPASA